MLFLVTAAGTALFVNYRTEKDTDWQKLFLISSVAYINLGG